LNYGETFAEPRPRFCPACGQAAISRRLTIPVYGFMALKRVYAGRWWPRLVRVGVLSTLQLMRLFVSVMALAIWSLLT